MAGKGYFDWSQTPFQTCIINGQVYRSAGIPVSWQDSVAPIVLDTHARTQITQARVRGGRETINLTPLEIRVEVLIDTEAQVRAIEQAAAQSQGGHPVLLYFDAKLLDVWALANRSTGQTLFETSRRNAWGLSGITRSTRPAEAYSIDATGAATTLTVVASSPPGSGEIYVPDATGNNFATIEAQAALSDTFLQLWYWPELQGFIGDLRRRVDRSNGLQYEFTFVEIFPQARTGL